MTVVLSEPTRPLKIPKEHDSSVTSFARSSWASFFPNLRYQANALIDTIVGRLSPIRKLSGNYYLVSRSSRSGIRLNPVVDYQCNEAAIGDRIPLNGTAAFRCILRPSRILARLRNSATACRTIAVGPSPRATGHSDLGSKLDEDVQ